MAGLVSELPIRPEQIMSLSREVIQGSATGLGWVAHTFLEEDILT
jgi:hypothetical protein